MIRTCAPSVDAVVNRGTTGAAAGSGVDLQVLGQVARQLGLDLDDHSQLMDLAAVAVTRLAWRDGPVEDWHGHRHRRISYVEIMRANLATTRLVRDLIRKPFDEPMAARLQGGLEATLPLFTPVLQIVEPHRRLPDGRSMAEFAPDRSELQALEQHVRDLTQQWAQRLIDLGPRTTLTLLACFGARWCWRWWLAPTWPYVVDGLVRSAQDEVRQEQVWRSTGMLPLPPSDWARLGQQL